MWVSRLKYLSPPKIYSQKRYWLRKVVSPAWEPLDMFGLLEILFELAKSSVTSISELWIGHAKYSSSRPFTIRWLSPSSQRKLVHPTAHVFAGGRPKTNAGCYSVPRSQSRIHSRMLLHWTSYSSPVERVPQCLIEKMIWIEDFITARYGKMDYSTCSACARGSPAWQNRVFWMVREQLRTNRLGLV